MGLGAASVMERPLMLPGSSVQKDKYAFMPCRCVSFALFIPDSSSSSKTSSSG